MHDFKNWNFSYKWSFTVYYLPWELNCVKLINNFNFWIITIINIISSRLKFYCNFVPCVSGKREKWITAKWKMEVKTLFGIIQIRFFDYWTSIWKNNANFAIFIPCLWHNIGRGPSAVTVSRLMRNSWIRVSFYLFIPFRFYLL